jgi:hypothetical protein
VTAPIQSQETIKYSQQLLTKTGEFSTTKTVLSEKELPTEKPNRESILRNVPYETGFHFSTEKRVYTGITAVSLPDFALKRETIDADSILFHYPRGDFQKWIQDTLGDKELANRMCFIQANLSGEELRNQLLKIVQKRISELK